MKTFQQLEILKHLRSNDLCGRAKDIRTLVHAMKKDIDAYDEELDRLESLQERLHREKAAIQAHAAICESAFAPVRRLPAEILQKIFLYLGGKTPKQARDPPIRVILAVCASWRQTALYAPGLWKQELEVGCTGLPLTLILSRMGNVSFSLPPRYFSSERFQALERSMGNHLLQCHTLCTLSEAVNQFLSVTPLLENIRVQVTKGDHFSISPSMHHLKHLDFNSVVDSTLDLPDITINLPPNQITDISLGNFTPAKAMYILTQASGLQRCSLTALKASTTAEYPPSLICPNLRALTLREAWQTGKSGTGPVRMALSALTLPNIKELVLQHSNEKALSQTPHCAKMMEPVFNSLLDLLERSKATLTRLRITGFSVSSPILLQCLRGIPSLTQFIYFCSSTEQDSQHSTDSKIPREAAQGLLEALTVSPEATWGSLNKSILLPCLAQLDIEIPGSAFTDQAFVEMIQPRWLPSLDEAGPSQPAVASIKSVRLVVFSRMFDDSKWRPLRRLQEQGLRIGITDATGDVRTRAEIPETSKL